MKEDVIGEAYRILVCCLGDSGKDGRIILKGILKK
jgi:hypothetical protein